jgi:hypothetical protein
MLSFLLLASLAGGAAALRHEPQGTLSLAARLATHATASDSGASVVESPSFTVLDTSAMLLSTKCSVAYDILNKDQGYLDAMEKIYDDARAVGKAAAKECMRHLQPCVDKVIGGTCKEDAQTYWTEDMLVDIPSLERACAEVLPDNEVAPVMWLNEYLVTKSPLSYVPFLGIEMKLAKVLPVYVPKSCRNDADEGMILAYFSDSCAREEHNELKQCKFSLAE